VRWIPAQVVKGVPHDMAILGYKVDTANTLRLWKAEARESFDFQEFNLGDYYGAVHDKVVTENITKVLYPNDEAVGQAIASGATIFFRVVFPARHDPYALAHRRELKQLPRSICRTVE